jgi:hypothetical protein
MMENIRLKSGCQEIELLKSQKPVCLSGLKLIIESGMRIGILNR